MKRLSIYLLTISALSLFSGCEALLEEPVKSEYTESTLLSSKSGLESLLADAYSRGNDIRNIVKRSDMTTDILTQSGGGENGNCVPLINFRWDPSNTLEAFSWMQYWEWYVMQTSYWIIYLTLQALQMKMKKFIWRLRHAFFGLMPTIIYGINTAQCLFVEV